MKAAVWSDIISDYRDERDIDDFIEWCSKIGIDLLLPCINHGTGTMSYHSSIAPMAKTDESWDPLGLMLEKAHDAGMEVHPWVVIASWGSPLLPYEKGVAYSEVGSPPLQTSHPEYFAVDSYGNSSLEAPSQVYSRGGNCYLDVGKDATQRFILELVDELVKKYPTIDGVHLDYIRYQRFRNTLKVDCSGAKEFARIVKSGDSFWFMGKWEKNPAIYDTRFFFKVTDSKEVDGHVKEITLDREYNYCFCDDCLERFQREAQVSIPDDKGTTEQRSSWILSHEEEKWVRWRAANVTALVKKIRSKLKSLGPNLKLSAATFPSYPECVETVGQDWVSWINSGLLDFVNPMDYDFPPEKLQNIVSGYRQSIRDKDFSIYAGIMTSTGYLIGAGEVKAHIDAIERAGGDGVTLFAYSLWSSEFRRKKSLQPLQEYDEQLMKALGKTR
jgi:uncharacterized lipoprotein YddW (UPF0748 family)